MSTFSIADTSPLFAYSPCVNCAELGAWQSAYSPRGDGYDQTLHQAATTNSTVSLNLTAISVEFLTSSESGLCDAEFSLDGGEFTDGCAIPAFPSGRHTVTIRPRDGVRVLQFFGVEGTVVADTDERRHNVTVDDTAPDWTVSGAWTTRHADGPIGQPGNQTVASTYTREVMSGFYNDTAGITTAEGAAMTLAFEGSGVYVYGLSGPEGGEAEVSLDGVTMSRLNMTNPWMAYSSLLFFATGLELTQHEVSITNLSPGRQLVTDYALVTASGPAASSSGINLPLLIGAIAGASAFLLITGVLIYLYCLHRRTQRAPPPPSQQQYAFGKGISYNDISPAKASSIDLWRKNAGPDTPTSGSGSSRASVYKLEYAAHIQPGSGRFVHSPGRSPGKTPSPPEYPDYLPYRGPIETRPPTPPSAEYEAPGIAGLDPRTQGWLTAASAASAATTPTSASARTRTLTETTPIPRSNRHVNRPEPIPLRDRGGGSSDEMHEIRLDSYYAQQDLISPASTFSSLGQMTSLAMGATRSVAKLWAPDTMGAGASLPTAHSLGTPLSGTPISSSPRTASSTASPTRPLRPKRPAQSTRPTRPERVLSSDSMAYAPTYTLAGYLAHSPEQLLGAGMTRGGSAQGWRERERDLEHRSPSRLSEAQPGSSLRRGVSIKSAKTMRSFFSGLLWNSPSAETPALPGSYESRGWGSGVSLADTPAARPDSDTFPASISRSGSVSRGRDAPLPPLPVLSTSTSGAGARGRSDMGADLGSAGIGTASTPTTGQSAIYSASRGGRDRALSGRTSFTSMGMPPMLRLDTGGENIFIELNPNSPATAVGVESGRSSGAAEAPSSWRRYGDRI